MTNMLTPCVSAGSYRHVVVYGYQPLETATPARDRWVRSGRDAVLVANRGGTVRTVVTRVYR